MNKIKAIDTYHIRSSRTIEILLISNDNDSKICYVYNYEGTHYRFFSNIVQLIEFFAEGKQSEYDFVREQDLDNFLEQVSINKLFV
ncbi:MAG: hypothetical protein FWC94_06670 [Bacteroidales bacterium]|nr:hypothetical protein [Bacteroidales bacterium]